MAESGRQIFEWPAYDADITELLRCGALVCLAYVWGKAMHLVLRTPPYVGELFAGFVLGPSLLDVIPHTRAMQLLGIVGVLLIAFEAGLCAKFHIFRWSYALALAVAICSTASAVFLGALALHLGPFKVGLIEGVAGGTSVCAASTSFSIFRTNLWSHAGPYSTFVASVATLEASICLTVFTIVEVLLPGWSWADVTQPAISAAVLVLLTFLIRRAMPSLMLSNDSPYNRAVDGAKPWQGGWPGTLYIVMIGSGIASCALAEAIRSTMVLGAVLGGALFAKVDGAEEAWRLGTKRIQRVLVATFFACSIGFVIPRTVWRQEESIVGGLTLLGFTIIAKCIVSLVVAGLFWPGPSIGMAIQIQSHFIVRSFLHIYRPSKPKSSVQA